MNFKLNPGLGLGFGPQELYIKYQQDRCEFYPADLRSGLHTSQHSRVTSLKLSRPISYHNIGQGAIRPTDWYWVIESHMLLVDGLRQAQATYDLYKPFGSFYSGLVTVCYTSLRVVIIVLNSLLWSSLYPQDRILNFRHSFLCVHHQLTEPIYVDKPTLRIL